MRMHLRDRSAKTAELSKGPCASKSISSCLHFGHFGPTGFPSAFCDQFRNPWGHSVCCSRLVGSHFISVWCPSTFHHEQKRWTAQINETPQARPSFVWGPQWAFPSMRSVVRNAIKTDKGKRILSDFLIPPPRKFRHHEEASACPKWHGALVSEVGFELKALLAVQKHRDS